MKDIFFSVFLSSAWRRLAKALVFAVLALSISACSILDDDDDDDDANKAPTSNAGADRSVVEGTTGVTLDGSGSSDSDGTIEKYAWTLTTSNDDVTLTGADTATASFTAPEVDADTVLVFRLTVTDNDGATATDEVSITVINNIAPTANAGKDQDVNEGLSVSLDGTGSSDSDGTIDSYAWTQVGEENLVEITNASSATASFTAPYIASNTTLEFMLTVTDNYGATNQANVKVTVANTTSEDPVANAGEDQTVFEGEEVTLNGSASDDGTIVKYEWTHAVSNPGVTLSGENTATASFTAPELGDGIIEEEMAFDFTVTDDDGATATDGASVYVLVPEPSSQVLFASQYELTGNDAEPFAISEEDGEVYSFSGGDFYYTWGLGTNPDYMIQRQAYGLQFKHEIAIDEDDFFGLVFKAPANSHVNITQSDTLVIQMGNGANTTDFPASHMVFTIDLKGDYGEDSWNNFCSYDQSLYADSRPLNNEGGTNAAWGNPFGIHTYRVALDSFTCVSGDMNALSSDLEEVVVKVVGGKDETASATENNEVLLQVGYIGFSNDTASVAGNGASDYLLFASQYELIDGATEEPFAISDEDGEVHSFSGGDFFYTWGLGENPDYLIQRQAYGLQFNHTGTIDGSSFFGLAFKAPDTSSLDVSGTDTLVIQTGNGAATDAFANSHMVYTLELNGGDSSCSYDLTLADGSRPSSGEAWTNPYGIHTYYVGLESFTCTSGDMDALTSDLEEVVVKVVGGKDATASATENNQVLLQVGYIAFAADDDDDE